MIRHFEVLVLPMMALTACGGGATQTSEHAVVLPPTVEVRAAQLRALLPVEGTVVARQRAEISTRIMARITAVPVDVGSVVLKGAVLIGLGTEDVAAKRAAATSAVMAAQAARDEAARQAVRMDTLYARDAVAKVQRDGARLALTQAESQLAMAEATLGEVETADSYSSIRAPFTGAVVSRHVNPGDLATPGMPLLTLEGVGPRDAVLAIPADLLGAIGVGTPVAVTSRDVRAIEARVRAIAPGADPSSRTVEVRAALPSDWPTGIVVTALVPAGTRTGIVIPASAVVRRGQLTGVRVATPEGVAVRWIRLGRAAELADSSMQWPESPIEVLSGLKVGERIVP